MEAGNHRPSLSPLTKAAVTVQPVKPRTRADRVRYLFMVFQDQPELLAQLRHDFSHDDTVEVLMDRRVGQRRRGIEPAERERRRGERRALASGTPLPQRAKPRDLSAVGPDLRIGG